MNCPDCGKRLNSSEQPKALLCDDPACDVMVVYKDDKDGAHRVVRRDPDPPDARTGQHE